MIRRQSLAKFSDFRAKFGLGSRRRREEGGGRREEGGGRKEGRGRGERLDLPGLTRVRARKQEGERIVYHK